MKVQAISLLACVSLSGCTIPWGEMPPVTYSGVVFDEARAQPATGVRVTAIRPGVKVAFLALVSDVHIGKTTTDAHGYFELSTMGGYATYLAASSGDGRISGGLREGLRRNDQADLRIGIRPSVFSVSSRGADLGSEESTAIASIFNKILFAFHAEPNRASASIDSYHRDGIIDNLEYDRLKRFEDYLTAADPSIVVHWGDADVLVKAFDAPIEFEPRKYKLFPGRTNGKQP